MNLTRNILITLATRIALLAVALVASVVLARALGPEGRGVLAVLFLLPDLATSLGLLGFEQANAVYAGLEPRRIPSLVWHSAIIAGGIGTLIAVGGAYFLLIGAPGLPALTQIPLWLSLLPLLTVMGSLLLQFWGAIFRGMNRILLVNIVEVSTQVALLTLILLFVGWLDLGVAGAVWASCAVSVGTVILEMFLLRSVHVWKKPSVDWPLWKRTARFALPAYSASVASYVNYRVGQFVIAALLSPAQLGFYVIAVGLAERLWIPTGAVATALLPHLTNSREHDPALPAVVARHVMIWTAAVCILVFALGDVLVGVLYSSAFLDAVPPLRWLLPGIFALSIGKVVIAEMLSREKVAFTVWVAGIAGVVNVAGTLLLVPRVGISGAALASSISYTVVSVIVIRYYLVETGLPWTTLLPRWSDFQVYATLWRRSRGTASQRTTDPSI